MSGSQNNGGAKDRARVKAMLRVLSLASEAERSAIGLEDELYRMTVLSARDTDDTVLPAFSALLEALNSLLCGIEAEGGSLRGPEGLIGELGDIVRILIQTAESCAQCGDLNGVNLTIEGGALPRLKRLTALLLAYRAALAAGIEETGRDSGIIKSAIDQKLLDEIHSVKWWHRIELAPGFYSPGMVKHGEDGSNYEETRFGIPADLTGKSVLDIGGWDGYFAFACEKRKASKIVVCDVPVTKGGNWGGTAGFNLAKKLLNSKVGFVEMSVIDLSPTTIGAFDITLQYGVLYHLENMLPALKATCGVTKEYTLLETATLPKAYDKSPDIALAGFLPGFVEDPTNYWYPNVECLKQMLLYAGYKSVEVLYYDFDRVTVKASK